MIVLEEMKNLNRDEQEIYLYERSPAIYLKNSDFIITGLSALNLYGYVPSDCNGTMEVVLDLNTVGSYLIPVWTNCKDNNICYINGYKVVTKYHALYDSITTQRDISRNDDAVIQFNEEGILDDFIQYAKNWNINKDLLDYALEIVRQ